MTMEVVLSILAGVFLKVSTVAGMLIIVYSSFHFYSNKWSWLLTILGIVLFFVGLDGLYLRAH